MARRSKAVVRGGVCLEPVDAWRCRGCDYLHDRPLRTVGTGTASSPDPNLILSGVPRLNCRWGLGGRPLKQAYDAYVDKYLYTVRDTVSPQPYLRLRCYATQAASLQGKLPRQNGKLATEEHSRPYYLETYPGREDRTSRGGQKLMFVLQRCKVHHGL